MNSQPQSDGTCCSICRAEIPKGGKHRSPWSFVPCTSSDVHLLQGTIICSECYIELWGTLQLALKNNLLTLKNCRVGQLAKVLPKRETILDTEAIFKKVVAAGSPPAADQSWKD